MFCFDGDSAGRKAAWRALEVSLPLATDAKPIRFLFLPAERRSGQLRPRDTARRRSSNWCARRRPLSEFLIAELRPQHDLNTPEGAPRSWCRAKVHLEKLTAPALRMQLLREFASTRAGIDGRHREADSPESPASFPSACAGKDGAHDGRASGEQNC